MALTKIKTGIVEDAIAREGFKNKIIGGDFSSNPWQRGTTFASITNNAYSADRWKYSKVSEAVHTISRELDAPTIAQAGMFTQHCLSASVTTIDTTIDAGQYVHLSQTIEGLDIREVGFGQAGSRKITLSFWHKHTKVGTYCVSFTNSAENRSYVAEYVQDVTNTWEKATVTLNVDQTGTWLYDNGAGLTVRFAMAAGTTFQTTANTWATGNFISTANQVNSLDNIANNFRIALVQLEVGSEATSFENRSFGEELSLCQRYYETGLSASSPTVSGSSGWWIAQFKVQKRISPTFTKTQNLSISGAENFVVSFINVYSAIGIGPNAAVGNYVAFSWLSVAEF